MFASNSIDIHANKFQFNDKVVFYLYQMKKKQFSFLLSGDQLYFDLLSLSEHQRKNRKSLKIHISGKSRYN